MEIGQALLPKLTTQACNRWGIWPQRSRSYQALREAKASLWLLRFFSAQRRGHPDTSGDK
jgi:hypothetical protein